MMNEGGMQQVGACIHTCIADLLMNPQYCGWMGANLGALQMRNDDRYKPSTPLLIANDHICNMY
jgi:hypothetical protein